MINLKKAKSFNRLANKAWEAGDLERFHRLLKISEKFQLGHSKRLGIGYSQNQLV